MKSTILLILLLLTNVIFAQYNFYSGLNEFYENHPVPDGNSVEKESTEYNEMKRIEQIWSPRLFAHGGDEGIAAAAIIDYAENYLPATSSLNPQWENLGPFKNDNGDDHGGVGQMGRICFDPNYDNNLNKTIYAASSFGGLWRTENGGQLWQPLTDYLPFTTVADVAVSYQNSNNIFIGTGYADGRFEYYNTSSHVNALNTFGIYRSLDYGNTWESISDGFISEFSNGGTIRRLIINPDNQDQLFVATTKGIFRCNNAVSTNPIWQKVLSLSDPALNDFRGLAFRPEENTNIVFASGLDIYKSIDGGLTFNPISINSLPVDYEIQRINIATTAADPDRLFAYIIGYSETENANQLFIYLYDDSIGVWENIYDFVETGAFTAVSKGRNAFAVSQINPNKFYFGTTTVKGTSDYTTSSPTAQSGYCSSDCHADIHDLVFPPNNSDMVLFAATDGGIGKKDCSINGITGWTELYNGLSVTTIWGFDDSDYDYSKIIIGNQDCGYNKITDIDNNDWLWLPLMGDGYGVKFDNSGINRWFLKGGETPIRHNYSTSPDPKEYLFNPLLCPNNNSNGFLSCNMPLYNHPLTNTVFIGLEEVFKRLKAEPETGDSWDNVWIQESDVYKTGIDAWRRQIQEFKIAESNPDYMYLITVGGQTDPFDFWTQATRLLRTTSGGIHGDCNNDAFTTIEYPGFDPNPQTFFPILSNFTIDPSDENRIWITYTGYETDYKVYRTDDGGLTWQNEDPNGTLANLPINDIEYQYGSFDRLFIATDAGVYIKDGPNADWEKFGDIPNVRVNVIKLNYCSNKLRAGTFGRGLWETDLPSTNLFNKKIEENFVWESNWSLKGNLLIEPGNTLTIKGKVNMPPDSKIIVKRGAKLIIDGGYITNGCGYLWKGIEVWGTSNQSQSYTYQGAVEMINGGTIENAICGIQTIRYAIPDGGGVEAPDYSYTGGLVLCDDGNFINNETAVKFWPYIYSTSSSFFRDCEFITNNNLIPATDVKNFIEMKGISGIKIVGSSFTDSHSFTNPADLTTGVLANDSRFYVWPYNGQPSVFTGLYYGIKSLTVDPVKTVNIEDSHFLNNFRSVYLSGISNATVILNQFNPWSAISIVANENYCLYLDGCTGYCIEENNFINPNTGIDNGIGMIINNSGTAENFIYNNYFSNLANAVLAQNDNRSITGVPGLQIKCNEFISNHSDIAVTLSSQFITATSGIAKYQGANQALPNAPAGNLFSHTGPPGTPSDINNAANHFTYYYHNNQFYPLQPWYYTANTVKIYPVNAFYNDQSCVSHLHHGGGGGGTGTIEDEQLLRQEMATAELKTDSVQSVLQALEDGGSTEDLKWEVDLSIPPESMEVYNELMNKSPYLSDTVMGSAIEKESVLVDAMIRDVMVANPQSAKSEELLQKLDERTNPVPEYMLGQILQGRNLVSTYEDLQSKLAFYSQQKAYLNKQLVRFYLNDTINPAATDSLIALYSADNSLQSKYSLAFLLLEQGTGLSVLNSIPQQITLSAEEMVAHQKMVDYYNLLAEVESGLPDSLQTDALYAIESTENGSASVYARNMLLALNAIEYNEPIILPDMFKSSEAIEYEKLLNTAKEVNYLEVIPNPAKDYAIIYWNLDKEPMTAKVTISGSLGNPVHEFSVIGIQDQKVVDTRNLKPGVYIATLYVDNRQLESVKFTIIK